MEITWVVDDGCRDCNKEHYTTIPDEELEEFLLDPRGREEYIKECIQEDFEKLIAWIEASRT